MKGTYTLLILLLPWSGISYASVSTVLATEGIYSDHNHGCLYPPPSQHRPGTQGTVQEYSEQETTHPDAAFVITGDFIKPLQKIAPNTFNTSPSTRVEIAHSTIVTPPSGTHTSPSPANLSANRITLPFCSCLLIGRNWNVKHPLSGQFIVGQTNRMLYYRTVLITWTGTCSGQRLKTT